MTGATNKSLTYVLKISPGGYKQELYIIYYT